MTSPHQSHESHPVILLCAAAAADRGWYTLQRRGGYPRPLRVMMLGEGINDDDIKGRPAFCAALSLGLVLVLVLGLRLQLWLRCSVLPQACLRSHDNKKHVDLKLTRPWSHRKSSWKLLASVSILLSLSKCECKPLKFKGITVDYEHARFRFEEINIYTK